MTWTTRLRKDAALYGLPPARTGRRGRPRTRGQAPVPGHPRRGNAFTPVTVTRYGKTATISAAAVTCLWPSVFGTRTVTVMLVRDRPANGCNMALVTTDTAATAAQVIERYASRWAVEVAIEDTKQVFGAGQARNRTARAVEPPSRSSSPARPSPSLVRHRRPRPRRRGRTPGPAPWYTTKAEPSTADMTAKLRRVLIAAKFRHLALTSQHPKKSASSAWPGKPSRISEKVESIRSRS